MAPWVFDPDHGGQKIPKHVQERTKQRILAYAQKHHAGKYTRLDIRFHGQFCYIDAFHEPMEPSKELLAATRETREQYLERLRNSPLHLVRLRYFGDEERWGLAFYTYSHDKYELSVFSNGEFMGPPEDAFEIGAVYLQDF